MAPNERVFKPEYAKELLRIAQQDLKTAEVLSRSSEVRPENTLFHVEQAIEKSIKAVLCHKQIGVPLTHDLLVLITKLPDSAKPPHEEALNDLTPFATIRRYEEGTYILKPDEIAKALSLGALALKWAGKIIGGGAA